MTDITRNLRGATLRQLRTFRSVAALGSVSAAARELHVTQPAVSMQLKELETCCGLSLYDRVGRGIQLTEAGREMADLAATVMESLRDTQVRLDAMRGLRTGVLRLAVVSTAKYFAPAMLSYFTERYPGVAVQLSVGNREDVVRRLAGNECDLAIMGRPPSETPTEGCEFAPHPLVIIASPGHPLAREGSIALRALTTERFLIRESGSGTRAAMEALFAEHALSYRVAMEVSSNETIKQAVMAGMGVAFISAHTIALEIATRRLVTLQVDGLPVMRAWHVLQRQGRRLTPAAGAFFDYLTEHGAARISAALSPHSIDTYPG